MMENNSTKADQMSTSCLPGTKCILLFELFTTVYLYMYIKTCRNCKKQSFGACVERMPSLFSVIFQIADQAQNR